MVIVELKIQASDKLTAEQIADHLNKYYTSIKLQWDMFNNNYRIRDITIKLDR